MVQSTLARDLLVVLSTAFIGGLIVRKLKLPLLIGYLLSGVIIGNYLSRYISVGQSITNIAEIGVALLLFTLGLEFSFQKIKEIGMVVIFGSLIQILLTVFLGLIVFPLFGLDFYSSLFLGACFSLSSTAVVLKILSDKGESRTIHAEMLAGWLFMQDIYTLPMFIILPVVGRLINEDFMGFTSVYLLLRSLIISLLLILTIFYAGKKIVPKFIDKIAGMKSREMLLIATVSLCLLFAFIFKSLGFSFAIGAFMAGILVAQSTAHHGIFAEIRPLRDIFAAIFFVTLGFMLQANFIFENWGLIIVLTIFVLIIKLLISLTLILVLGYHTKVAASTALSLISVGEFAFILALYGVSSKLISTNSYLTILSVTFLSLIISIPISQSSSKIYFYFKKIIQLYLPSLSKFIQKLDRRIFLVDENIENHVIILGHGRVGRHIGRVLNDAKIPYVVVDYNYQLIQKLQSEGINVIYGDPSEVEVLKYAGIQKAKVLIIAYTDRYLQDAVVTNSITLNPGIKIISRVHHDQDQKLMKSLGVNYVVQPEFEAALSMTKYLLEIFQIAESVIDHKLFQLKMEHG